MTINRKNRQTNFDICLQYYGSIDLIIKLCSDNNITDLDVPISSYYIDETLVQNKNVTGYEYATQTQVSSSGGNLYINQSGSYYINQSGLNYAQNG